MRILYQQITKYYQQKAQKYGAMYKAVDWNSLESQELRFAQLVKLLPLITPFTLNDLGCGYGTLYEYLQHKKYLFSYQGYDIAQNMIDLAHKKYKSKNCLFIHGSKLRRADYTITSGIFNVKLDISPAKWKSHIVATINDMYAASNKGFAFNMLSSYSDRYRRRDDLFYADPCFYFNYCKRTYSSNVALLHDYNLYEFTLLVRKG